MAQSLSAIAAAGTAAVLVAGSGLAAAPDARGYATRTVAGWTVAPSSDGAGCFLTREYDRPGQTTVLLGIDADGTHHLSVLNANWSIRPKEKLKLTFRLSKASFPGHFAVGIATQGKQGFVTSFGRSFPAAFAASRMLDITRGDIPVERLNLEGSGAAVAELRRCVASQRAAPPGAGGGERPDNIPKDPFAPNANRASKK